MSTRAEDYTILVGVDRVTDEYVAVVREFPGLSWVADSKTDAAAGLMAMLNDLLADMHANGESVPEPSGPHLVPA